MRHIYFINIATKDGNPFVKYGVEVPQQQQSQFDVGRRFRPNIDSREESGVREDE